MKKSIVIAWLALIICPALAQENVGKRIADRTKQRTVDKTEQKVDEKVDKALDKIFSGSIFKKGGKDTDSQSESNGNASGDSSNDVASGGGNDTDYTAYKSSNYDFLPGQQVLFYEDFSANNPSVVKSYEPVRIEQHEGKSWLVAQGGGFFHTGWVETLPNDFTLEMEVLVKADAFPGTFALRFLDDSQKDRLEDPYFDNFFFIDFSPVTQMPKHSHSDIGGRRGWEEREVTPNQSSFTHWHQEGNRHAKIALSRKGNRMSAYVDEVKVWDNVDAFLANIAYMLAFHHQTYFMENTQFLITNIRLATNVPNAKSDLATEGKFVTNAIYFDVASSRIRPESWSILKEVAASIQSVSGDILIVGHTDSDGATEANQVLSERRAESVRNTLVNEFGIPASRLVTEGKGEEEPVTTNNTTTGKALNRRVEFVRK